MSISLTCPSCGAAMALDVCLAHEELRASVVRIIGFSVPLGQLALRYLTLFNPPKNRMRPDRMAKLLEQIVPDLQRNAITHQGREWSVPQSAWEAGLQAMLDRAKAGKFSLPLSNHNYLYQLLANESDKVEAQAEAQTEHDRRVTPQRDNVQVNGQSMPIGEALQVVFAARDPALAKLDADNRAAAPMSPETRAKLAALKGGQK